MGTKLFCECMKEERKKQGYSIDDLAKKLNTSVKHVTMLEAGGRNFIAVSNIPKMAAGFDMTTKELLDWTRNLEEGSLENSLGPSMRTLCYRKNLQKLKELVLNKCIIEEAADRYFYI